MSAGPVDVLSLILVGSVFGLVFSLWCIVLLYWRAKRARQDRQIRERLGYGAALEDQARVLRLWVDNKEATAVVPAQSRKLPLRARLEKMRKDADWEAPVASLLLGLTGILTLIFLTTLVTTGNPLLAILLTIMSGFIVYFIVERRIGKQQALFERQLLDALGLGARSLRAGHPLIGAFHLIVEEMNDPIRRVFAQICQEQELGVKLEEAIRKAALDTDNEDMKLFATSIIIQLRSGGNLADLIERLADVIRERMRLTRRVRVLTAQTQYSKRVLIAMPFIIFTILCLINPQYINPLLTTLTGRIVLSVALLNIVIGTWVMNRMALLRY